MKIERIEISNLRAFHEADIPIRDYNCFVGANGAGKLTVLTALNIFFRQSEYTGTNLQFLEKEDFHNANCDEPVTIRVTFADLNEEAKEAFKHYVRNEKLIITAEATMSPGSSKAEVRHFGERLVLSEFAPFFEAVNAGAKAAEYNAIYEELRTRFELPNVRSKDDKAAALREYESARPEECTSTRSSDQFYGVSKGANRLERFIQWVYVPAVKDAVDEQVEAKNGALGKLLSRAVRAKSSFEEELADLKTQAKTAYQQILNKNQGALDEISQSLNRRLSDWAHQGARLRLEWQEDDERSIRIEEPWAHVRVGEGSFQGQLARLGHGLQRSYLIALLQELALYDRSDSPTLILAIEEPELYQHPPQARHLSDVLSQLASEAAQVIVCSHSPYFVSGYLFEDVRMVRRDLEREASRVTYGSGSEITTRLSECTGKQEIAPSGMLARLQQILQPQIAEMFFANSIVFVEGQEDIAYIKSFLELNGFWEFYRRLGCHFIAVDKKSELLRPILVAEAMGIPSFVIFDADGNAKEKHKELHETDNQQLLNALGLTDATPFPEEALLSERCAIWPTCMSDEIENSVDPEIWKECRDAADASFGHSPGMKKNAMHIAKLMEELNKGGVRPEPLLMLQGQLSLFVGRHASGIDRESGPR